MPLLLLHAMAMRCFDATCQRALTTSPGPPVKHSAPGSWSLGDQGTHHGATAWVSRRSFPTRKKRSRFFFHTLYRLRGA